MGITIPLLNNSPVYLDTNCYISHFENHLEFAPHVEKILLTCARKNIPITASQLLLTQLLIAPLQAKIARAYERLDNTIPNFSYADFTKPINQIPIHHL